MTRARPDIPKPGTPEARERRVARVDLTRLSDDQRRRREAVMAFGVAAFGPVRWQSPLAEALGRLRQQDTAPVQIAAWVSGARPVPARIINELLQLAPILADELERRVDRLRCWPGEPPTAGSAAAAGFPEPRPPTREEIIAELMEWRDPEERA